MSAITPDDAAYLIRAARSIARRITRHPQDVEDLAGEGLLAAVKAAPNHDPDRGAMTTYLYFVMGRAIRRARGKQRALPPPVDAQAIAETIEHVQLPRLEHPVYARRLGRPLRDVRKRPEIIDSLAVPVRAALIAVLSDPTLSPSLIAEQLGIGKPIFLRRLDLARRALDGGRPSQRRPLLVKLNLPAGADLQRLTPLQRRIVEAAIEHPEASTGQIAAIVCVRREVITGSARAIKEKLSSESTAAVA